MSEKFILVFKDNKEEESDNRLFFHYDFQYNKNDIAYLEENNFVVHSPFILNKSTFKGIIKKRIKELKWEKNEKIYVSIHPESGGDINNVVNNLLPYQEKVKEISGYDIKITYHGSQNEYLPKLPVNELEGFKDALIEFHKEILEKKIEEKEEMNLLRKKIEEEKTNKQQ